MPSEPNAGLLFVYAVDGGTLNTLLHVAHKLLRPETYPCTLCAITYGTLSARPEWTRFLKQLDMPTQFLHRDEFRQRHPGCDVALPAIFRVSGSSLEPLVAAPEIDAFTDVQALIAAIQEGLAG